MLRPQDHVLLVANYAPDVGYAWWLMQRFWVEIAGLARKHDARTFLAYPREGPTPEHLLEAGIEPLHCDFNDRTATGTRRIMSTIRESGARNLYLTDRAFFDTRYRSFRSAGIRHIVNHDHTPGDRPPVRGPRAIAKRLRNSLPGMQVDHWIALSPLMKERARLNGLIPDDRISIVSNGIDPIAVYPSAREKVLSTFFLPENARVVVTVGRAHPYKRIDFMLQVAREVEQADPDSPLVFLYIGDGPQLDELRTMARELGLSPGRVHLAGHRNDVREILPGCDMALHAARGEGFSLAILEYMSAGLATLVPDIPSVCQAITSGDTGVVYPDADSEYVARKLKELSADGAMRARLGEAAAQTVCKNYTLDRTMEMFRKTIEPQFWAGSTG